MLCYRAKNGVQFFFVFFLPVSFCFPNSSVVFPMCLFSLCEKFFLSNETKPNLTTVLQFCNWTASAMYWQRSFRCNNGTAIKEFVKMGKPHVGLVRRVLFEYGMAPFVFTSFIGSLLIHVFFPILEERASKTPFDFQKPQAKEPPEDQQPMSLRTVQVFFRHGARTPLSHLPHVRDVSQSKKN